MSAFTNKRGLVAVIAATIVTLCLMLSLRRPYFDVSHLDLGLTGNSDKETWWAEKGSSDKAKETATYEKGHDVTGNPAPANDNISEVALDNGNTPELSPQEGKEKLAIVTFLSGTLNQDDEELDNDNYFVATRMLIWQLLHQEETRVQRDNIDVIVMVTPSVTESRRERLLKDGAILYAVDFVHATSDWFVNSEHEHRWDDVLTKFRTWEMDKYSRILLLDGDIILRDRLDGVFDDPGAQFQTTLHDSNRTSIFPKNTTTPLPPLPDKYLVGGLGETAHAVHPFPPTWDNGLQHFGVFNAGFFLIAPSVALFNFYLAILNTPNSFDPKFPEQNILNMVHNWTGPLPWKEIGYKWNIVHVNDEDMDGGVVSVHLKWFWEPQSKSQQVRDLSRRIRWQMKGFYDGWDLAIDNNKRS